MKGGGRRSPPPKDKGGGMEMNMDLEGGRPNDKEGHGAMEDGGSLALGACHGTRSSAKEGGRLEALPLSNPRGRGRKPKNNISVAKEYGAEELQSMEFDGGEIHVSGNAEFLDNHVAVQNPDLLSFPEDAKVPYPNNSLDVIAADYASQNSMEHGVTKLHDSVLPPSNVPNVPNVDVNVPCSSRPGISSSNVPMISSNFLTHQAAMMNVGSNGSISFADGAGSSAGFPHTGRRFESPPAMAGQFPALGVSSINDVINGKNVSHQDVVMEGCDQPNLNFMAGGFSNHNRQHHEGEHRSNGPIGGLGGSHHVGNAWRAKKVVDLTKYESRALISPDGLTVKMNSDTASLNLAKLEGAVVGKVLGKALPFGILQSELHKRWSHHGMFKLSLLTNDCFLCVLPSREARDAILMGGPWFIMGQLVALDKWTENFNPRSMTGFSSPTWIRLPLLPLQFWDQDNLSRIGSMLGDPLWVDEVTLNWGRMEYARICVRMDFSKKLPNGIWIDGGTRRFFQPLMYEGLSKICFGCGHVGHKEVDCPRRETQNLEPSLGKLPTTSSGPVAPFPSREEPTSLVNGETVIVPETIPPPSSNGSIPSENSSGNDGGYGPWVLVQRKKKVSTPSVRNRMAASIGTGHLVGGKKKAVSRPVASHVTPAPQVAADTFSDAPVKAALSKPTTSKMASSSGDAFLPTGDTSVGRSLPKEMVFSASEVIGSGATTGAATSKQGKDKSRLSSAKKGKGVIQVSSGVESIKKKRKKIEAYFENVCFQENLAVGDASPLVS